MTRTEAVEKLRQFLKYRREHNMTEIELAIKTVVESQQEAGQPPLSATGAVAEEKTKRRKKKDDGPNGRDFESGDKDPELWKKDGVLYAAKIGDSDTRHDVMVELSDLAKFHVDTEKGSIRIVVQKVK